MAWLGLAARAKQSVHKGEWSYEMLETLQIIKQVIFAGQGPNRTHQLIMKRAILIEVYRSAHRMIENNFYLTHRTIRHSSPKMLRTISRLRSYIEEPSRNPHTRIRGRSAKYEIPDHISEGFGLLHEDADLCAVADGLEKDVNRATADDIGVN